MNTPRFAITPEVVAQHGLSPAEYQRVLEISAASPTSPNSHLLGDVE